MSPFTLQAPFEPAGDQPKAIAALSNGINQGLDRQTLLGVTGSGKTYTMAAAIANTNMPALVISHNKTLAAQLAEEFREFFPENKVEYFVSYYDYYQPEAYIPRTDTYIAKDASINDEIDKLRHAAMESILTRKDVIVVASVSCIYGLGSPTEYLASRIAITKGDSSGRKELIKSLIRLQYSRNDIDLTRGTYRVRGDVVDIFPAGEDRVLRVEFFGPSVERVMWMNDLTGEITDEVETGLVFPATFFISDQEKTKVALHHIREELAQQIEHFRKRNKLVEAQRIEQRTTYDLEMIEQLGYVSGVENYSRHLDGRKPGEPPSTLLDYFIHQYGKEGFLTFIDESHMTIPQISAMHGGDAARKTSLVEHGFRLPSAKDNRPLKFNEFEDRVGRVIFVSATPSDYETNTSKKTIELIVRPTGLLDPTIEIKPTQHQVDDVIDLVRERIASKQRVLVTTLTKRMAEELSTYLTELGIKSAYLHSDIDALERIGILRDLRLGKYDVLVGINLLREGLDLPEVSLVTIMDADKEGYLRSQTALIQTMGRAARHLNGHVIMYADRITGSMERAIDETTRRRDIQKKYNKEHGIMPRSITKAIREHQFEQKSHELDQFHADEIPPEHIDHVLRDLQNKMQLAAQNLEFERAAEYRDAIGKLRKTKKAL